MTNWEKAFHNKEKAKKEAYALLRDLDCQWQLIADGISVFGHYTRRIESHAHLCEKPVTGCIFAGLFSKQTAAVAPRPSCADPPRPRFLFFPPAPAVHCAVYKKDAEELEKAKRDIETAKKSAAVTETELVKRLVRLEIPHAGVEVFVLQEVANDLQNGKTTFGKVIYSVPKKAELYEFARLRMVSTDYDQKKLWTAYDVLDTFF